MKTFEQFMEADGFKFDIKDAESWGDEAVKRLAYQWTTKYGQKKGKEFRDKAIDAVNDMKLSQSVKNELYTDIQRISSRWTS